MPFSLIINEIHGLTLSFHGMLLKNFKRTVVNPTRTAEVNENLHEKPFLSVLHESLTCRHCHRILHRRCWRQHQMSAAERRGWLQWHVSRPTLNIGRHLQCKITSSHLWQSHKPQFVMTITQTPAASKSGCPSFSTLIFHYFSMTINCAIP